ncbi:MAG: hypothetical protein HWN66_05560 [Candidatus Helarchaeota archaeon]|nr:hypothetical protein [Candidatus Helarchaeota archaeon]
MNVYLEEIGGALSGKSVSDYKDIVEKWLAFPRTVFVPKASSKTFDIIIEPGIQAATECSNAEIMIHGATYDPDTKNLNLYVKNRGTIDLTLQVVITYSNGRSYNYSEIFDLKAQEIETFELVNVGEDHIGSYSYGIQYVTLISRECPDVQGLIQKQFITGYKEPGVCGDGICGEEEDCVQDCWTELSLGIVVLECTSAAGGFFNAIIDLGTLDKKIFDMTVDEVGEKFKCKSEQTEYGCIVDIPPEDIIIEVGRTDVGGNWILANTRVPGTLEKQIIGPGSWNLGESYYQNESKHIFFYLHFTKETHPTNKKCWIGDTWLENADESTKNFYKCCYDYDGGEIEVKIYIRIPATNKYIYTSYMLHNHRLTIGPSKPEILTPIDIQIQDIHGYYNVGPAGFTGYVLCIDVEDDAHEGNFSIFIDGTEYVHTGEGIGSYYRVCVDESFGIYQPSPWGYSGRHEVRVKVISNGREGEDVKTIDFSTKTVTRFTVERGVESCDPFCTNYTYHIITISGYSPPLHTSYDPEYDIGGSHVRIIQNDGREIDLETHDYCTCDTFNVIPVCTGPRGDSCTPQPAQFENVIYDGNAVELGYCKSTEVGIKICYDNKTSVSIESL